MKKLYQAKIEGLIISYFKEKGKLIREIKEVTTIQENEQTESIEKIINLTEVKAPTTKNYLGLAVTFLAEFGLSVLGAYLLSKGFSNHQKK